MGVVPWSPLAFGMLSGKYDRSTVEGSESRAAGLPREAAEIGEKRPDDDKRLDVANPFGDSLFTERNWAIVDVLRRQAEELGETPARIALSWVVSRPGISSTLIGVGRVQQVIDNISALDLALSENHIAALDEVSQGNERSLYSMFSPSGRKHVVFGGNSVRTMR